MAINRDFWKTGTAQCLEVEHHEEYKLLVFQQGAIVHKVKLPLSVAQEVSKSLATPVVLSLPPFCDPRHLKVVEEAV
jgi:hypothetical protein